MYTQIRLAFAQTPHQFYKDFCLLAIPISFQLLLISAMGLIDMLMISHLGTAALAAMGLINKTFFVLMFLVVGLATGTSILAAQFLGSKDLQGVKIVLSIGWMMSSVFMIPAVVVAWFFPVECMQLLSADPAVVALGSDFLHITAPYHLLMAASCIFSAVLRAHKQSVLPMCAGFVGLVFGTGLSYGLIFGKGGLPALGMQGAAWAFLAAKSIEISVLFAYLYYQKSPLRLSLKDLSACFHVQHFRLFCRQSLPLMLNELIWALGIFSFTFLYSRMGTHALAAMSLVAPIEAISIEIFIGFTSATSIMVARHLGANEFTEAKRVAWVSGCLITMGGLLFGLLLYSTQPWIVAIFSEASPEVLHIAQGVFWVLAATLWLRLYNVVACVSILRSGGDVQYTLYLSLVVLWVIALPLTAYVGLYLQWPVQWVFATAVCSEALAFAPAYAWRIKQGYWLKNLVQAA